MERKRQDKQNQGTRQSREEIILEFALPGPAAIAKVHESKINHPLIMFQIPALQNCEQNKMFFFKTSYFEIVYYTAIDNS